MLALALTMQVQLAAISVDVPQASQVRLLEVEHALETFEAVWPKKSEVLIKAGLGLAGASLVVGGASLLLAFVSYGFAYVTVVVGIIGGIGLLLGMSGFIWGAVAVGTQEWKRQSLEAERDKLRQQLSITVAAF